MRSLVDPDAAKRSLMLKQKPLCDGSQTGRQCKHVWLFKLRLDVENPDTLRDGERGRRCLIVVGDPVEFGEGGIEMPVYCNRYEPGDLPHDPSFDKYDPLSPADVEALRQEWEAEHGPSTPVEIVDASGDLSDLAKELAERRAAMRRPAPEPTTDPEGRTPALDDDEDAR